MVAGMMKGTALGFGVEREITVDGELKLDESSLEIYTLKVVMVSGGRRMSGERTWLFVVVVHMGLNSPACGFFTVPAEESCCVKNEGGCFIEAEVGLAIFCERA